MRLFHRVMALAVLALLAAAPARGAEADLQAKLDETLKAACRYQAGNDAGAAERLEGLLMTAAANPQQRELAERKLLAALAGDATMEAKSLICRQIRNVASVRSVAALEALLGDPYLSHPARYSLATMEYAEASEALHGALGKTAGAMKLGVIGSLGDRRYAKAAADLGKLLASDPAVAEAAASSLGKIGGDEAVKALESARGSASEAFRGRIDDALLACADHYLAGGKKAEASRIYRDFYKADAPRRLRLGALRGLVGAAGADGLSLLVETIKGPDRELQRAAIGFVPLAGGQEATGAFANLLATLTPEAQELLVYALAERGDVAGAAGVAEMAKSADESVRVAALEAMGTLGSASSVKLLAEAAAGGRDAERQIARASLARLRGSDVDGAIAAAMGSGDAKVRVELILALAGRGNGKMVADLAKLARDEDASVRWAAISALGVLIRESEVSVLVDLALNPKAPEDLGSVENALGNSFRRISDVEKQAAPILAALEKAPAGSKPVLIRLLTRLATPKALAVVRDALKAQDAAIQDAAVRAMADWPNVEASEYLLQLAGKASDKTHRVLALRGYVRLAGLSKDPTAMYLRAIELADRVDDKRLVLAGLGSADSAKAMDIAEKYLKDEQLRNEAALAVVQIAERLRQANAARATSGVKAVLANITDPAIRQKAQAVVNELEKFEGHIIATWLIVGPYEERAKDANALYDTAFGPEKAQAEGVQWKPLNKGAGKWEISLDSAIGGGDNRVAYVRTCIISPVDQDAQLEIGSDDGFKAWFNGKLVGGRNGDGSVEARANILKVRLRQGSNDVLMKVINHSGGWGFCCRVRKPDGSAIEGLKYEGK